MKGIIFDMDGLMIDSERVTYEGYVELCEKLGKTLTVDMYVQCLGKPVPQIWDVFYKGFGSDFPAPEIMKANHARMAAQFEQDGVPVKPGLRPLLDYLKAQGYKTCVATSSTRERVDKILAKADLANAFDETICGDEVERGKPDPEIFLKACQKLHLPPEACLVLEDSEMGIQAASQAGIRVVCVPDMKYPEPEYAKKTWKIVERLDQVIPLLRESEQS